MGLDDATLQVAFGLLAATMLVLFFFVVFRPTRSAYSGYWCAALTCFLLGEGAHALTGALQQSWADAVGNMLNVLGAACAWAATRSLNGVSTRWWQLMAAPALAVLVAIIDDDSMGLPAGELVFFAMMPLVYGLSAREVWKVDHGQSRSRTTLAVAATVMTAYYAARCVVHVVDGGGGGRFSRFFDYEVTGVSSLVFLSVVSFTMSMLSNEQETRELQIRATRDGLTGVLNRAEFLRLANQEIRGMGRQEAHATLILADLDDFKGINDTHGHPAGDRVLQAFARAATRTVRSSDLIGRYGGDEFILLLPRTGLDRAEQVTMGISSLLGSVEKALGFPMPTVSYGVTAVAASDSLEAAIASADTGLYRAKVRGVQR